MTLALIDGDIIAYRAACASQSEYDWGDTGGKVSTVNDKEAVDLALQMVAEWSQAVEATEIIVTLTGDTKWRKRVLPSYQTNRGNKRPIAHSVVRKAMMDAHPHHLIKGLEADDVMGILATTDKYADRAVIVSIDKDMRTIPGRHLNPAKDKRIVTVTPDEADYAWMTQTLVGDSSDGYKGCPGVGPVGAYKILPALGRRSDGEWLKRAWPLVVSAFAGKKLSEDDALMQARMARILRRSDYDKTTKEVILWHPTTPTRIAL